METGRAGTTSRHRHDSSYFDDRITEQRLAALLKLNSDIASEKASYRNERERFDAALMTRPVESSRAVAYFGLMIGSLPPFALAFRIIGELTSPEQSPVLFVILLMIAGIVTGVAGYLSGRYVSSMLGSLSRFRRPKRIALVSLIGLGWGAVSGAIGGLFLFIVGAVFASLIGGVIGAVALPLFVVLHSPLRRGDVVEMKHFLPISLGITLSLCALILGF